MKSKQQKRESAIARIQKDISIYEKLPEEQQCSWHLRDLIARRDHLVSLEKIGRRICDG